MLISARDHLGPWRDVKIVRCDTGEVVKYCIAADTDEGWFEHYVIDPVTGKIAIANDRGNFFIRRVRNVPFDVVMTQDWAAVGLI